MRRELTREETEEIEARHLRDMALRFGTLQDAERRRREAAKREAYERARTAAGKA